MIDSFVGRKGEVRPRTAHEARLLESVNGSEERYAHIVKTALRQLALRLGTFDAERPILVLFSEGFTADTSAANTALDDLGGLPRAASRFHISTYTFNPTHAGVDTASVRQHRETLQRLAERQVAWPSTEIGFSTAWRACSTRPRPTMHSAMRRRCPTAACVPSRYASNVVAPPCSRTAATGP